MNFFEDKYELIYEDLNRILLAAQPNTFHVKCCERQKPDTIIVDISLDIPPKIDTSELEKLI